MPARLQSHRRCLRGWPSAVLLPGRNTTHVRHAQADGDSQSNKRGGLCVRAGLCLPRRPWLRIHGAVPKVPLWPVCRQVQHERVPQRLTKTTYRQTNAFKRRTEWTRTTSKNLSMQIKCQAISSGLACKGSILTGNWRPANLHKARHTTNSNGKCKILCI